jgi:hypothetical protein
MKNKLFSILVSIIFLPVVVLAQYVGFYFGKILYFIYENIMFLNMPKFLIDIAPLVISGFLAGYVAAKAVQLIYKNYNVNFCLILPAILIIISLLGTILNPESSKETSEIIGTVLRENVTFGFYLFTLKNVQERI